MCRHAPDCEVALFTEDVARLVEFYERLLGRAPDSSSESHASFDLGGTTLFIHVAGGAAPHTCTTRTVVL